jgi:spore maturation protein CgeB
MKISVFGLSLSSSWGNGHATTYRGLLRALHARGHEIVFYERDVAWYAEHRDLPSPDFCALRLYRSLDEIDRQALCGSDAVVVGSFVTESDAIVALARSAGSDVLAFYDIDTPVTLARLRAGDVEFISPETIAEFDCYLSFSGGPILDALEREFGATNTHLLGCSADTERYRPTGAPRRYALGYLGTYDESRQPALETLLIAAARRRPDERFIVAGPQYPQSIRWPENVERVDHLPPDRHAEFYSSLDYAINVTRAQMVDAGFSPSVRIFEAAACGTAVITDRWAGLDAFFTPGEDILVADDTDDVLSFLDRRGALRQPVAEAGRARVVAEHSAAVRAGQLEAILEGIQISSRSRRRVA